MPTSPTKTWPRLTPIWIGSGRPRSAIRRRQRTIRPSSSAPVDGSPVASTTFPPSSSMSVARKVTSSAVAASCTAVMTSSSASATASGPLAAISASTPLKRRKAMVAARCSGSLDRSSRWLRRAGGR